MGREIQGLLSHRPTKCSVLIVLGSWINCIEVVQAEMQEHQAYIRP